MKHSLVKKIQSVAILLVYLITSLMPITTYAENNYPVDGYNENIVQKIIELRDRDALLVEIENEEDEEEEIQVIVELKEKSVLEQLEGLSIEESSEEELKVAYEKTKLTQDSFFIEIAENNIPIEVKHEYQTAYNGVSIKVARKHINVIENLSSVVAVHIVQTYEIDMTQARSLTNVEKVWENIDTNLNYKGEGMLVAVLDSGIDPTHRDLKLSSGVAKKIPNATKLQEIINNLPDESEFKKIPLQWFSEKVPTGYNWADQDHVIWENNVLGTNDHGMHIAGIIAANGNEAQNGIKGVAPEAQLISQKVVSNSPTASTISDDDLIAAINHSVVLGVDVINISSGQPAGEDRGEQHPLTVAMKNAADSGVIIIKSAGNSGHFSHTTEGNLFPFAKNPDIGVTDPTFEKNLVVASLENTTSKVRGFRYTFNGASGLVEYELPDVGRYPDIRNFIQVGNSVPLVYAGFGTQEELAKLIVDGVKIEGSIVMVKRSPAADKMLYSTKVENAHHFGAVAVILIDEQGRNLVTPGMGTYEPLIPYVLATYNDINPMFQAMGRNLMPNGQAGTLGALTGLKIEFGSEFYKQITNGSQGKISDSSTWGTTDDLRFYPDITAPGTQIWSLKNNNGYTMKSGTSMAAPHIAGVSTLVYQAFLEKYPNIQRKDLIEYVNKAMMNTAKVIEEQGGVPYLTRRQGAGLVQADSAIETPVVATPKVELKSFQSNSKTFTITLENLSNEVLMYEVNNSKVFTNEKVVVDGYHRYTGRATEIVGAMVEPLMASNIIDIQPKGTKTITFELKGLPNQNFNQENPGQFVEGFVKLISLEGNPTISVPFMGFHGDWNLPRIIDKPFYRNDSFHKHTGLYGVTNRNEVFKLGYDFDEKDFMADLVAISNHKDYKRPIQPLLSYLRNAKETEISVYYAEKTTNGFRKKEKVYDISKEGHIKKNFTRGTIASQRMKKYDNWRWDGTFYDINSGRKVPVSDGWYLYEVRTIGTYPDAQWQTEIYPFLIDSVAPTIESVSHNILANGNIELSFSAKDNYLGTGIAGYYIVINDDFDNPVKVRPTQVVNGKYTLNKSVFKANGEYRINVVALDYAGNGSFLELNKQPKVIISGIAENQPVFRAGEFIRLNKQYPETIYVSKNELQLSYILRDNVRRVTVKVIAENGMVTEETQIGTNLSYTVRSLKEGNNTVLLIPATGTVANPTDLPDNAIKLNVFLDTVPPNIYVTRPSANDSFNSWEVRLDGRLSDLSPIEIFEINGQPATVDDRRMFQVFVPFNEEGLHNITLYAKDKAGNEAYFLFPVNIDRSKPILKLDASSDPLQSRVVPLSKNRLELKGTIRDEYTQAALYINNNNVAKANLQDVKNKKEIPFDVSIPLKEGKNVILFELFDGVGNAYIKQFIVMRGNQFSLPTITTVDLMEIKSEVSSQKPLYIRARSSENINWLAKIINEKQEVVSQIEINDVMDLSENWVPSSLIKDGDYQIRLEGTSLDGRTITPIVHSFTVKNSLLTVNKMFLSGLNGVEKKDYNHGEQVVVHVDFSNEYKESLRGIGFIQIKSNRGEVIYIGLNEFRILPSETQKLKNGFTMLPSLPKGEYTVELFMWDNEENMKILSSKRNKQTFNIR